MKNNINLKQYASALLPINEQGFTNCLFHKDDNASMRFYERRFYCFGCAISGDIYDLIMKLENVGFRQAKKILEDEFGKPTDSQIRKARKVQAKLRKQKEEQERLFKEWLKAKIIIERLHPEKEGDEIIDEYVDALHRINNLTFRLFN